MLQDKIDPACETTIQKYFNLALYYNKPGFLAKRNVNADCIIAFLLATYILFSFENTVNEKASTSSYFSLLVYDIISAV